MMPGLDGPELIRLIRQTAAPTYTYIILLTAKGDKGDIVGGLETGADDYLTKPFHPGELRARVSIGERILHLEARLRESNDQLEVLATQDSVTGLLNRRAIQDRVDAEWNRAMRGTRSMGIVLLDVDHFKAVNDQHGHAIGDQALHLVAQTLMVDPRTYDLAGRWGGEEFLLLLPEADLESAGAVAERVRARMAATPLTLPDGSHLSLTVSAGVASTAPAVPATLTILLQQADEALYSAKRQGRNRVCVSAATSTSSP